MSEFTNKKEERVEKLVRFAREMMVTEERGNLVKENEKLISQIIPSEVIALFDIMVKENPTNDYTKLKAATNKILHLFHSHLMTYPDIQPAENSFLNVLTKNNTAMENC